MASAFSDMQSRIKREALLLHVLEMAGRMHSVKNQVPAMAGHSGGHQQEQMLMQQLVTKGLLPRPVASWHEPVGIGDIIRLDNMDAGEVSYPC